MSLAIGIDFGGTSTKLALVSAAGEIRGSASIETRGDAERFADALAAEVKRLLDAAPDAIGVGLSVAGFVDGTRGVMTFNPNIDWLQGFPIGERLKNRLGLPVRVEGDGNAAALGEYFCGAGRGSKRLLCLSVGTGLGGAVVVAGELVRFAYECIGDPGHVLLLPDGPLCGSGCRGCAEALVAAPALEARAAKASTGGTPTTRQIIDAARAGDATSVAVLAETGYWLGRAIGSLAPLFLPDRVVVAGGVAEAGELLLGPARDTFLRDSGEFYREGVEIRKAELGWQAGVVGAAAAFHKSR
jgi:glucokinase